jgi:hypothetical protein
MPTSSKKRIFVSFAIEDAKYRDFIVGQSKLDHCPFEFIDMSVKEAWDEKWKTNCRTRIKGCDGVITLISKNTAKADGARWEIKCAIEEGKPLLAIHIDKNDKASAPVELGEKQIVEWSWDTIKQFIEGL